MRRIAQNQRERERDRAVPISTNKQVICAIDNDAIFRQPRDREGLALCSHEEAESGMMSHIADAADTYTLYIIQL